MTSHRPGIATVPPPTLEKQLEVLAAAHTLAAQDDELLRRRCEEVATLRRAAGELALRFEELQRGYGGLVELVQDERRRRDPRLRSHVIKYNADQPRVPAGEHGGGQWTSGGGGASTNDAGNAPASGAARRPERGPQYAQATLTTRTDATDDGGNVLPAAAAPQNPKGFFHELVDVTAALIRDEFPKIFDERNRIWSWQIPAESAKRPEWLVDELGQPILDGRGNQLVGPHDLPPEAYVQAGLAAKSHGLADTMHEVAEVIRGNPDLLSDEGNANTRLAVLASMIAYEILPFAHAGSFDAERFDNFYVRDYRPYTSVALGVYMAAAGVSREDMLTIGDFYAAVFSRFHEDMDPNYPHSTKQDVQDNLLGYELYESGRLRRKN